MCTFSQSVVLARLLSSLQFYKSTRRLVSVRNIVRGPSPSSGPYQPATTSTNVPSRAMCHVAPIPTVIRFCTHLTSNTVSPQDQPMWQRTSPPTAISPEAKANQTVPDSSRESPCLSLSSPQMKPNRLFPVPGEIERVATSTVLHQHPSRR